MIKTVFPLFATLICLISLSLPIENLVYQPKTTYGVIVDCGSSGTRAHLFEWDSELPYPELLNDIEPMRDSDGEPITKKITPGLSSNKDNPDYSSVYMEPLIDFIIDNIPKESHHSTAIYVMGTAGMRLLDNKTQLEIMNDIVKDIKSRFNFAKVTAHVITGSQEGMYEWITVNSKAKRFSGKAENVADQTQAIIEMGGSSIQVTYQLGESLRRFIENLLVNQPDSLDAFRSQLVKPEISKMAGEKNFELFSVSFLGLGGNSAREAYVDLLIDLKLNPSNWIKRLIRPKTTSEPPSVLKDPCLPRGASEDMDRPVRMLTSSDQSIGFNLNPYEETFRVNLVGTGDYSRCRQLLSVMLSRAKEEKLNCKPDKPCTMSLIGTPFLPFGLFHILGLSEFYYVASNMMDMAGKYDRELFVEKTKEICGARYSNLLELYPSANKVDPERVRDECFKAVWVDTFLSDGLGMPIGFEGFETVGKIKGDQIDWTLGAVLDKSHAIEDAVDKIERRVADQVQ